MMVGLLPGARMATGRPAQPPITSLTLSGFMITHQPDHNSSETKQKAEAGRVACAARCSPRDRHPACATSPLPQCPVVRGSKQITTIMIARALCGGRHSLATKEPRTLFETLRNVVWDDSPETVTFN